MLQTKYSVLTTVLILQSNLLTSIVMWKLVGQVSERRRKDDPQRNLNESENGSLGRVTVVPLDETSPLFPHLTSETTHFRNALSKILNFPIQLDSDWFTTVSVNTTAYRSKKDAKNIHKQCQMNNTQLFRSRYQLS